MLHAGSKRKQIVELTGFRLAAILGKFKSFGIFYFETGFAVSGLKLFTCGIRLTVVSGQPAFSEPFPPFLTGDRNLL